MRHEARPAFPYPWPSLDRMTTRDSPNTLVMLLNAEGTTRAPGVLHPEARFRPAGRVFGKSRDPV